MSARSRFAISCVLAASLAVVSCGQDKGPGPGDAGLPDASKEPIVGGKLGQVIASAAGSASAAPKDKAKDGDAPPENGIFAEGEADKKQAKGAPPKLDVMSDGEGNKVQLAQKLDAGEQKTVLNVAMRMGQGRLPTIDFALSIKADKRAKDAPADAPAKIVATVTGATLPSTAGMPKDLPEAIGKLKGTVVRWDLTAAGAASNFTVELPKGAGEGLELVLDALVDTISMMTAPLPAKPVGKDAYWIVADRAKAAAGMNVVRYRVFKVTKIEGDAVTMSIDIRQYSADQKLKLDQGGQKAEMPMDAFESKGKGEIVWKADSFLPLRGEVTEGLAARLAIPGAGGQGGRNAPMVQTELNGTLGGGTGGASEKP